MSFNAPFSQHPFEAVKIFIRRAVDTMQKNDAIKKEHWQFFIELLESEIKNAKEKTNE